MHKVKPEERRQHDPQNMTAPADAPQGAEGAAQQDSANAVQLQANLETKLEELRAEIARHDFAERQLRARSAQRAAAARAEALDSRTEASNALARAADADAQRERAERERTEAHTVALEARAEAAMALARAADADAQRLQAEFERTEARARVSEACAEAATGQARAAQAEALRAEALQRSLRLEASLRHVIAALTSHQNTGLLQSIRQRLRERRHLKIIRSSPLFDPGWYIQRYPEVSTYGFDPAYDFLRNAALLRRDPSPGFDSTWYLGQYSDVAQTGMNPLLHYLLFGRAEGREIRPAQGPGVASPA